MENLSFSNVRKKVLFVAVSSLLIESGFDSVDRDALETLAEMLQAFIVECGNSSKNFCELTGRTEPILADVIVSLANMGITLQGIEHYAKRNNRTVLPALQATLQHKPYNMLQAGTKQSHPGHIPNYLPPFPDPHAYIRTPTHKQPVTEYEAIREKAAAQKRDIERALTRFLAKTSETHNLFNSEDNHMFPLIACKPLAIPYLSALLPQDQIFDPEDLEYEAQVEPSMAQPRKRHKSEKTNSEDVHQEDEIDLSNSDSQKVLDDSANNSFDIDNPYLAATKMPVNNIESTPSTSKD